MTKYTVIKKLELEFEVEAESPSEAYQKCLEQDDTTFGVVDCDYTVLDEDGDELDYEY